MKSHIEQLTLHLQDRVRLLKTKTGLASGQFVLYWMRTAVRVDENPALDVAIEIANQCRLPVLIYHALSERYPFANDRHHTFILEGAKDVQRQVRERFNEKIGYVFHLERPHHRGPYLRHCSDQAAVVVTEEMPVHPLRSWTETLARRTATPVLAVDTACVVPMQTVGRAFERAFEFRKFTKGDYEQRTAVQPCIADPIVGFGGIDLPFEPLDFRTANIQQCVGACEIDHSIGPVVDTVGGSAAGHARWSAFKKTGLIGYAKNRNNALLDGVSRMSAYLHYGMVSPLRIARECAQIGHAGSEKYLDELLIWRELAYVFCFYRPDHGRLSAIPNWALDSLREHESDSRGRLYSWEAMARAETGDDLWNAAQRSLLIHGELHNNVRMTWGKAILNWTADARTALAVMIDLNHRYALDGRDPASYAGILWCLGQFDRPFPPARPILGTVRPRPTSQHAERLDVVEYAKRTSRPLNDAMPSVAVVGAGLSGLICARTLNDHGFCVTVFEKSRGLGGRMATRRANAVDGELGEFQFDHGAQYFTARDNRFKRYVESWSQDGLVERWDAKIVVLENGEVVATKAGTDRYVATPTMNTIGKHLSRGLDVRRECQVAPLVRSGNRWCVRTEDDRSLGQFDVAIVSAPAYQTANLLGAVPDLVAKANAANMQGCWALMLAVADNLTLDFDAAFVKRSPISWIAKNSSKPGRSKTPETWVIHASPEWSEDHIEHSAQDVEAVLIAEFWKAIGVDQKVKVTYAKAHRWRYAIPAIPLSEPCLFDEDMWIGACGDWCAGPRVEGAFLSGMAAAGRVMGVLKQSSQDGVNP